MDSEHSEYAGQAGHAGCEKTPREPFPLESGVSRRVVDAALEVHRSLGPGFAEPLYEAALCHELHLRGIAFDRQPLVRVRYKDCVVGEGRLDLVVEKTLVVELKAVPMLAPVHTAQLVSYLKATGRDLGLLLNFGGATMKAGIRRVVLGARSPTPLAVSFPPPAFARRSRTG